ncbi:MAG: hypothetical protein ACM3U1_01215 [Chloroflexota bacterium]
MSATRTIESIVGGADSNPGHKRDVAPAEYLRAWLRAASLKTFAATAAPLALGAALAYSEGSFRWKIFLLSALCFALIHIIGNMLRLAYSARELKPGEYYDPAREIASPRDLKITAAVLTALAVGFGMIIALLTSKVALAIGLMSLIFAYIAAGGPFPISIPASGRALVFILYGISAALGSYYVNAMHIAWNGVLLSAVPGLLGAALYDARNLDGARSAVTSKIEPDPYELDEDENSKFLGAAVIFVYLIIALLALSLSRWGLLVGFASLPFAAKLLRDSGRAGASCGALANELLIVTSLALSFAFIVF